MSNLLRWFHGISGLVPDLDLPPVFEFVRYVENPDGSFSPQPASRLGDSSYGRRLIRTYSWLMGEEDTFLMSANEAILTDPDGIQSVDALSATRINFQGQRQRVAYRARRIDANSYRYTTTDINSRAFHVLVVTYTDSRGAGKMATVRGYRPLNTD